MARWHSCNVLHTGPERREVWHFSAKRDTFVPDGVLRVPHGQPLPANVIGKTLRSLWQKKLNLALLPPEQVFLRAVQLPAAGAEETLAMVELQLEKLSPLPLAQIVWSMHPLPTTAEGQQTILLAIVQRDLVEQFLGKLEGEGFMADRLELPLIDQLAARPADHDGAWVYPATVGGADAAVVAWWFGGTLHSIGLINTPAGAERARAVADQFGQMAWAGDLEGWLKGVPGVYLVAAKDAAVEWEPLLSQATGQRVEVIVPPEPAQLALATVRRAAKAPSRGGLLPDDYSTRYHQQFVDRIWMRGLGAVILLYCVVVAIYLGIAGVQSYRAGRVEDQVKATGGSYTNALQLKARLDVLRERQELKFAALDCWRATADLLPEGVTLQGLDFRDGRKLLLSGTAPGDAAAAIQDFNDKLRKVELQGVPLFTKFDVPNIKRNPAGTELTWSFNCELNRGEEK
jgi:hypothetical protein